MRNASIMYMDKTTELNLIASVCDGDTGRYRELVDAYSGRIFALVYKMTGVREDAEELAQDVFVKAFFSLKSFRGESSFSTWLFRIAYNMTISSLRKKKKIVFSHDIDKVGAIVDDTNDEILKKRVQEAEEERLETAISELPPQDIFLLTAFYKEDKSLAELTQITGLSMSNVKIKMFRIKQKLSTMLTA